MPTLEKITRIKDLNAALEPGYQAATAAANQSANLARLADGALRQLHDRYSYDVVTKFAKLASGSGFTIQVGWDAQSPPILTYTISRLIWAASRALKARISIDGRGLLYTPPEERGLQSALPIDNLPYCCEFVEDRLADLLIAMMETEAAAETVGALS